GSGPPHMRVGFECAGGDGHPDGEAVLAGAHRTGVAVSRWHEPPGLDAGDGPDCAVGGEQELVAGGVVDPVPGEVEEAMPSLGADEVALGPVVEVAVDVPTRGELDVVRVE